MQINRRSKPIIKIKRRKLPKHHVLEVTQVIVDIKNKKIKTDPISPCCDCDFYRSCKKICKDLKRYLPYDEEKYKLLKYYKQLY